MMHDLIPCKILIVDDTPSNIDILVDMLGDEYEVSVATSGEDALKNISRRIPDLILLDIVMPGMDGYSTCEIMKKERKTKDIPVIFLTALSGEESEERGLALGAVDYITKPFSPALVKARVRNNMELKRHRDHLEELVKERTRELELTQAVTIQSLAMLAETRDFETGGHIRRTQSYVRLMGERLNKIPKFKGAFTPYEINLLYQSAPLHDIGKVGVPDRILLKPEKLTPEEFEQMKKHTVLGLATIESAEKTLGTNSFLRFAKQIIYTHHERWDGSGYPQGLKGENIPIPGRLMAIADVYDALISKRVYKPPFFHGRAVEIIEQEKGNYFDPDLVDAFMDLKDEFKKIAIEFADYREERESLADP